MKEFWNDRFKDQEYVYGTQPNQFFKEQIDALSPGKVLFVCEGEGRNAVYAAQLGWEVHAFDLSEEGQKKAMQLAAQKNVTIHYQIENAATVAYPDNTFDAIVLIFAHFPATIRQSIHQKVVDWLLPGGLVIMEAFHPNQLHNSSGGPRDLSMLYSLELVEEDFPNLDILRLTKEVITLDEGRYHQGTADVIRFIGKKTKE